MISIPFPGNKSTAYRIVKPIVEEGAYTKVFEPFGGSCVLSVNLYNDGIVDRAYINDYDHFFDDYERYLDYKDWIVEKCYDFGILKSVDYKNPDDPEHKVKLIDRDGNFVRFGKSGILPIREREYLQSLMKQVPRELWDYFKMGHQFTFSAVSVRKVVLKDFKYFTRDLSTVKQRKYLDIINKLDKTNLGYRSFLEKYRGGFGDDSIIIVDPPYITGTSDHYKGDMTEQETLKLLTVLDQLRTDFIFFNDDLEQIELLFEIAGIPFEPGDVFYTTAPRSVAKVYRCPMRKRRDAMIYKHYS